MELTTKEKSEELFNKYFIYLRANLLNDEEAIEDAKVCALIAVDEILNTKVGDTVKGDDYWQEVKKLIDKL